MDSGRRARQEARAMSGPNQTAQMGEVKCRLTLPLSFTLEGLIGSDSFAEVMASMNAICLCWFGEFVHLQFNSESIELIE
jgi:hypothetical protein